LSTKAPQGQEELCCLDYEWWCGLHKDGKTNKQAYTLG